MICICFGSKKVFSCVSDTFILTTSAVQVPDLEKLELEGGKVIWDMFTIVIIVKGY